MVGDQPKSITRALIVGSIRLKELSEGRAFIYTRRKNDPGVAGGIRERVPSPALSGFNKTLQRCCQSTLKNWPYKDNQCLSPKLSD